MSHRALTDGRIEMAGYSPAPQARKLGLKPGIRLMIVDRPDGWDFETAPDDVTYSGRSDPVDVVVWFVPEAARLATMSDLAERIFPAGAIWVAWPRKAGGHVSDVDENLIRATALGLGLVDVKVAAIDQDWSGLKICWRKQNRTTPR